MNAMAILLLHYHNHHFNHIIIPTTIIIFKIIKAIVLATCMMATNVFKFSSIIHYNHFFHLDTNEEIYSTNWVSNSNSLLKHQER